MPIPITSTMISRKMGAIADGQNSEIYYDWTSYENMSKEAPLAVVAGEDQLFPEHFGFDFEAMGNAFDRNKKGRKLTAQDVEYSFKRIVDKNTASPGAWIFNNRVDSVNGFTAINDSVFQLKLIRPFQSILGILSMQYCSVIAKEAVEKYKNDFRRHPVGSGPFSFVSWEEGQALVLKKNDNYF